MSALVASFDPDADDRPRRNSRQEDAIEIGGFTLYERFIRRPEQAADRWLKLTPKRRQLWIEDFAAAQAAYSRAGGR